MGSVSPSTTRMRLLLVVLLCAAVAQCQRRPGRGPGRGRGNKLECADGTRPDCSCEDPPCRPGGNLPVCTCEDGSTPQKRAPCDDGSFPECPGACEDGSDPVFSEEPFVESCADGGKVNNRLCTCADGTELGRGRGRPGGRRPGRGRN